MMYFGNMVPFFGVGVIGFVIWIIWLGIIVSAILAFINWVTHHNNHHKRRGGHAIEILRERYAKGDITKEKFEEIREELEK